MILRRFLAPLLITLALVLLFFKLPETPNPFDLFGCKTCQPMTPYMTLIAAGYFALLGCITLLFPAFPKTHVARGGLLWAVLLALTLTYLNLPEWCSICLICHACHIAIWTWTLTPNTGRKPLSSKPERLCLVLFAPLSIVALL